MLEWFRALDPPLAAALVSSVVSVCVAALALLVAPTLKYGLDSRLEARKLDLLHRSEQRKALRDHIARHKGRVLETLEDLATRIDNFLREDKAASWLGLDGTYPGNYYAKSFAERIVSHWCAVQRFADSALYIDATVAAKDDLAFVKALRINIDIWRNADLFDGLDYDTAGTRAHFYRGEIYRMTDALRASVQSGDLSPAAMRRAFSDALDSGTDQYERVFRYLDGMKHPGLRSQRLVAAQLIHAATLNAFGYDHQSRGEAELRWLASWLLPEVRQGLLRLLKRHHLHEQREFNAVVGVLGV